MRRLLIFLVVVMTTVLLAGFFGSKFTDKSYFEAQASAQSAPVVEL